MPVIDMRCRPPTPEFKQQHKDLEAYVMANYPIKAQPHSAWDAQNVEGCIKEMEELDYIGVAVARQIPTTLVPNDHVRNLADKYPERILPVGGVDPRLQGLL